MRKAYELEDRLGALALDYLKLRDRASKLWSEAFEQIRQAEHENRHRDAEDWRAVADQMLNVWLETGLEAQVRAKLAGGVVTQILDRS